MAILGVTLGFARAAAAQTEPSDAATVDLAPETAPPGSDAAEPSDAMPDGPADAPMTSTDAAADRTDTGACQVNANCTAGHYCSAAKVCSFDCRFDADCASGGTCNSIGLCIAKAAAKNGGCGCRVADQTGGASLLAVGLLASATWLLRRRRPR